MQEASTLIVNENEKKDYDLQYLKPRYKAVKEATRMPTEKL